MKRLEALLLLALMFRVAGCSMEKEWTHLTNITTSDCLMYTDMLAAKDMATDSIGVLLGDGSLTVTHYNMMLDCETGDNITTTMQMIGDTITVTENVGEQGLTDCVCLYNNSFQIVDVPWSRFTLVIKEECSYMGNIEQRIVYQHTFTNK